MSKRSITSLRKELAKYKIDTSGLIERSELERALKSAEYYAAGAEAHAMCATCRSGEDLEGNEILLCDGKSCPVAMHMQCCDPPLSKVPTGKWLCPACDQQATAADVNTTSIGASTRMPPELPCC